MTVYQKANQVTNSNYSASTTYNTPSISIGSGITAGGGSATVSHSQSGTKTYYYYYTSGSTSGPYYSYPSGSTSIAISSNGNNRFSLSGNKLSHSSMGTYVGTDSCTVKVTGSGSKTNTASTSATNAKGSGTYSISCSGTISLGAETGGAAKYQLVSSKYGGTYTSGSSYADNTTFSIYSKPSWVYADVYGDNEIQVDATDNTSTSSRSGTVTVRQNASNKTCSFTVSQEGAA